MLAHVANHVRGPGIQLFNQFFVTLLFTIGIFGVMLRNKKIPYHRSPPFNGPHLQKAA